VVNFHAILTDEIRQVPTIDTVTEVAVFIKGLIGSEVTIMMLAINVIII
jgi:hypothetical protein